MVLMKELTAVFSMIFNFQSSRKLPLSTGFGL